MPDVFELAKLWWASPDIATHGARCEAAKAEALALGVGEDLFSRWVEEYRSTFDKGGQKMTAFLRLKLDAWKEQAKTAEEKKVATRGGAPVYTVTTYDVYLMGCRLMKERPVPVSKPWKQHWDTLKRNKDGSCKGCGSFNGHDRDCSLDLENH